MAEIGTPTRQGTGVRGITGYQWLVLFIAWAGWSLDITDFTLYGLVLRQALTELLGGNPTLAQIGSVGGLVTTVGLLGWAESSGMKNLGPVVFGRPLSWMVLQLLAVATVVALVGMLVRRRGTLVPVIAGIVFLPWAFYWGLLVP